MKSYTVTENDMLGSFTDNVCAQASFYFRALLKSRDIRVNGEKVSCDVPVKKGDVVCYYLTPAQERRVAFKELYRDAYVVVVDKESGVNSEAVFSALKEKGEAYFIHRLDRNTEGLMIFACTKESEAALLNAFRTKNVLKVYHALVVGRPAKRHAVLSAFLEKDEKSARVRINESKGEKIVTEYELLEERGDTSLLKVTLHTGKTHQIRAHLAYIGCPVAGDGKYGDSAFNQKNHLTRQRLLAKELTVSCGELPRIDGVTFVSEKNL